MSLRPSRSTNRRSTDANTLRRTSPARASAKRGDSRCGRRATHARQAHGEHAEATAVVVERVLLRTVATTSPSLPLPPAVSTDDSVKLAGVPIPTADKEVLCLPAPEPAPEPPFRSATWTDVTCCASFSQNCSNTATRRPSFTFADGCAIVPPAPGLFTCHTCARVHYAQGTAAAVAVLWLHEHPRPR